MPARHGIGTLSNIIDNFISNDQADSMDRDVTNDEIHEACFSLHPNKASGPDGFNTHFFKKTWDIVGEDAAFDELSLLSGILANQAKSNIFTLGLSSTTNQQLINLFGYTIILKSSGDKNKVWGLGSVNLKLGVLRLQPWVPDFNPSLQKSTNA
ncbi:hypothetical protein Dsin_029013 [Dipteronia sinensis]|uniref:RNA-directed DNA polymerase, eukaryota, reverse transcriptase zinc-binding domain protein n=1 Tax=Dipteronia sinensis TaxID=43782 RepID=A0AAD9ZRV6_9ROSI|nr:hypothetical protein Dsin_029013 [Dipteronia sinensis]